MVAELAERIGDDRPDIPRQKMIHPVAVPKLIEGQLLIWTEASD